jgi:putative hydrolase of the HAD superfamily
MSHSTKYERCRAIVFDLDDTLYAQVDFKRSGFRAVAGQLAEWGVVDAELALASMERQLAALGPSHPRILDAMVTHLGLTGVSIGRLVSVFRDHVPAIQPFAGISGLLANLRGRYRLGLLTDGSATVQRRKVDALGLASAFDAMLFSDEMATQKPDQILFEWFERQFGLAGGQLMYVGDNPAKDFLGANKRGWRTLRVLSGEHAATVAETMDSDAELTIGGVADLRPLLFQDAVRTGGH